MRSNDPGDRTAPLYNRQGKPVSYAPGFFAAGGWLGVVLVDCRPGAPQTAGCCESLMRRRGPALVGGSIGCSVRRTGG